MTAVCDREPLEDEGDDSAAALPTAAVTADELASERPAPPRPAPSAAAVSRALSRAGVHRLVAMCRTAYAGGLPSVRVGITVDRTGEITDVAVHDAEARFARCLSHALRTADVAPYDGGPIAFEEEIVFDR